MKTVRLDRLGPLNHASSICWLWRLYWHPKSFIRILARSSRPIRACSILFLNALPYGFLLSLGYALWLSKGSVAMPVHWNWIKLLVVLARLTSLAVCVGIFGGMAGGSLTRNWLGGVASSLALSVAFQTTIGFMFLTAWSGTRASVVMLAGIAGGAVGVLLSAIDQILGELFIFSIFGSAIILYFVSALSKPTTYLIVTVAIAVGYFRVFYLIIHPWFVWPKPHPTWYPKHPVAWDDFCIVPFPGLYRLLVAYAECDLQGIREIHRLQADRKYLSQDMQAFHAKTILLARTAAGIQHLSQLSFISAKLPQATRGPLSQVRQLREWIDAIVRQQISLNAADRPFLRYERADSLVREISNFPHRLASFRQPLQGEFTDAAKHWLGIAQDQLARCRRQMAKETIQRVFSAGLPIDRDQNAYVLRDKILGLLEAQINLTSGCPGIILYARRRMGKSTLLKNLNGQLPESVAISALSMQSGDIFSSLAHFTAKIASVTQFLSESESAPTTLAQLQAHLHRCNDRLRDEGRRLLLALDEYEQIDTKIQQGVFSTDLLACMRESIQSDSQIAWLFAGSNQLTELSNPDWPSYLVSARTIELPPFTLDETRLLLTDPMHYSAMAKLSEARPRFTEEFWGPGNIERIQAESAGWPLFVQLIAQTVVDILNREEKKSLTLELLARSFDESILAENPFIWLLHRESKVVGEWQYLSGFRQKNEQPPPEDENIRRSLRRRQLVLEESGLWRLRVPLMARWLHRFG